MVDLYAIVGEDISIVKPAAWLTSNMNKRKTTAWKESRRQKGSNETEALSFVDFLKSLPIFHSLRVAEIEELEISCPCEAFRAGTEIIAEGAMSDTVYIIREGSIAMKKLGSDPVYLTRGDYFGECALTNHTSTSSYSSVGNSLLICFAAKTFEKILHGAEAGGYSAFGEHSEQVSGELNSLSRHIDQFLDILALYDPSDSVSLHQIYYNVLE